MPHCFQEPKQTLSQLQHSKGDQIILFFFSPRLYIFMEKNHLLESISQLITMFWEQRPVCECVVTKQLCKMLFQCVQKTLKPHAKYQHTKKAC